MNLKRLVLGCIDAIFFVRRQIFQVNIRWKALDEIYKIYMLLHRSDLKFKQKFVHVFADSKMIFQK